MEPYLCNYEYFEFLCEMLYLKRNIDDTLIALWKIEESFEDLLAMLENKSQLSHILQIKSNKIKIEKLAIRALIKAVFGCELDLTYNNAGRPFLVGDDRNISISHTNGFAAIAINPLSEVGIDIEFVSDKILRVKDRIISKDEYIDSAKELTHILLHWCAKESMFKVMDSEGVDYIDHMHVAHFDPVDEGWFKAAESRTAEKKSFDVFYIVNSEFVLTCLSK